MSSVTAWLLLCFSVGAHAVGPVTMGGSGARYAGLVDQPSDPADAVVNFLDPLSYTKPAYLDVSTLVSIPTSFSNNYWVNLSSSAGDGSCSQASPCNSLNTLSGKTTSGGTKVFLKGSGRMDITSGTFAGTSGAYIVVQPWPGDSTPTVMTAQAGCTTADANRLTASGWQFILWDGGPDMLFRWVGSGGTSSQNCYTAVVNSNDQVFRRVRLDGNDSSGPVLGIATSSSGGNNFKFVNSELYNNDSSSSYYGVYTGGGSSCPGGTNGHQNLEFRASIFRGIDGRGIQIEPRGASSGVVIDGNAFHGVGYNTNGGISGDASGAVQVADACGVTTTNVSVSNNLMWDLGGGGTLMFQDCPSCSAVGNTIWEYGNATPASLNSHAITSWSDGQDFDNVRNNIILGPGQGGIDPLSRNSGWTPGVNDNACEAGSSCGSGAIVCTVAGCFDSTTASSSFLKPNGAALNGCLVISGFETDYLGASRGSVGAATDCGAINEP